MYVCPECGEPFDEAPDLIEHRAAEHSKGHKTGAATFALAEAMRTMAEQLGDLRKRIEECEAGIASLRLVNKEMRQLIRDVSARQHLSHSQVVPVAERIAEQTRKDMDRLVRERPAGPKGPDDPTEYRDR